MVERMVKIVKQILTMYMDPSHTNWDEYLQSSIAAYNTSKQASLKISPYEALYARDAVKVSDVMLSTPVVLNTEENVDKYTENLRNSAAVIHAKVNVQLEKARQVQKHYYDRAVKNSRKYEIGDLVSVVNERSISGQSHAFKDRAIGPFKIVGVFNDKLNYQILGLNDNKINKIHYNRLLPYKARENNSFVFGKYKTTVSEVSKTPSSRVNVELARSTNSNEFDVDVDFIISLKYNAPRTVRSVGNYCEYCGGDLVTKRKLLQHVNVVHRDLVLQHIQDVIDCVVGANGSVVSSSSSSDLSVSSNSESEI